MVMLGCLVTAYNGVKHGERIQPQGARGMPWTLSDIPWHAFEASRVEPVTLALARSACLVEYNSFEYGRYLRQVFADAPELNAPIAQWAEEEVQHGQVLRRWCEMADPTFDFERSFRLFIDRIRIPDGTGGSVRGSRTGELLARCVIECGTSMYYSGLAAQVAEPVLKNICKRIASDEFHHYRLFLDQCRTWASREALPLIQRLRVVLGRMIESEDDELAYAYYCANPDGQPYRRRAILATYLQSSLAVLRRDDLERSLGMAMTAAGIPVPRRVMGTVSTVGMRIIRWRMRSLAHSRGSRRAGSSPRSVSEIPSSMM